MATRKRRHYFLDKAENVTKLYRVLVGACIALLLVDFLHHRQATYSWEGLWGFYGVFGFVGIVVLILAAKQLRRMVAHKENFYHDDDR
jgi:uncharacterized membrane protein YeaQ/YmgE (transglycosylase-associated protein family)